MNQQDRGNLQFLLSASTAVMQDWYATATPDDRVYAMELLQMASSELTLKELELLDARPNLDMAQAQAVLSQFALH